MKTVEISISTSTGAALNNIGDVVDLITGYSEVFTDCIQSISGLEAWFAEYVASEHFVSMTPEIRKEAFKTFSGLMYVLTYINDNIQVD